MSARDIRYGRRGGRWADARSDAARVVYDRWRAERDAALEAAAAAEQAEQMELWQAEGRGDPSVQDES